MSITLCDRIIKSVYIVDDDPGVRKSYEFCIQELDLQAIHAEGPFFILDDFVNNTMDLSQAAICDHKLRVKNYANFNGAEVFEKFYEKKFPAILCTAWIKSNIEEIRSYMKFIPVLLNSDEIDPSVLEGGFRKCLNEFNGDYDSTRKPWKTLVRVEEVDEEQGLIYLVVPGWHPREVVGMKLNDVPTEIIGLLKMGKIRFYANVNLGADCNEKLYITNWISA